MPRNCTDEQIKDMLLGGYGVRHTAATLKCATSAVTRVKNASGIGTKVNRLTLSQRAKINTMLKEGTPMIQIAREVGCRESTVRMYRDKLRTPEQWAELRRYREANAPSVRNSGLPTTNNWADGDVADPE